MSHLEQSDLAYRVKGMFVARDILTAISLSIGWFIGSSFYAGSVQSSMSGNRAVLYGACMTAYGFLLGCLVQSILVMVAQADNRNLKLIRQTRHYPKIAISLTLTVRTLAVAMMISLVAFFVDTDAHPYFVMMQVWSVTLVFVGVMLTRAIWILGNTLVLIMKIEPRDSILTAYLFPHE